MATKAERVVAYHVIPDGKGGVQSAYATTVTEITDDDSKVYEVARRDVDMTAEDLQTLFGTTQDAQALARAEAAEAKLAAVAAAIA